MLQRNGVGLEEVRVDAVDVVGVRSIVATMQPWWRCLAAGALMMPLLFVVTADAGYAVGASTLTGGNTDGGADAMQGSYAATRSTFGDHGVGQVTCDMHAGIGTSTTHACASPSNNVDPAGGAGSYSVAVLSYGYRITSNTLPNGAPVTLHFSMAYARSVGTTYTAPKTGPGFGDVAQTGLNININIAGNPFLGTYNRSNYFMAPPNNESSSGIMGQPSGEFSIDLPMHVNDAFSLHVEFGASSGAQAAVVGAYADANGHLTVLWGGDITDGDAQIVSLDDSSLFPGSGPCTEGNAVKQLTPPIHLGACNDHDCPNGYYCFTPEGQCDAVGECIFAPTDCDAVDDPVCGCDGGDYANECDAAMAGASVLYHGPCRKDVPGDLDGDHEVGQSDRIILCEFMGTDDSDPNFYPPADLNHDGVVNQIDLQLFNELLPPCMGDIVTSATFMPPGDGIVDGADLAILLGAWGNRPSCADFVTSKSFAPPPDGKVDGADLAVLLGAWGPCN